MSSTKGEGKQHGEGVMKAENDSKSEQVCHGCGRNGTERNRVCFFVSPVAFRSKMCRNFMARGDRTVILLHVPRKQTQKKPWESESFRRS